MLATASVIFFCLCILLAILTLFVPSVTLKWVKNSKQKYIRLKGAIFYLFIGLTGIFVFSLIDEGLDWASIIISITLVFFTAAWGSILYQGPELPQKKEKQKVKYGRGSQAEKIWRDAWGHLAFGNDVGQERRKERANYVKVMNLDYATGRAKTGGRSKPYTTTLTCCDCPDFQDRKRPCKHMYAVANALGIENLPFNYEDMKL